MSNSNYKKHNSKGGYSKRNSKNDNYTEKNNFNVNNNNSTNKITNVDNDIKKDKDIKKKNIKVIIIISIFMIIFALLLIIGIINKKEKEYQYQLKLEQEKETQRLEKIANIKNHYGLYVKSDKEAILYNDAEQEIGKIGSNVELSLEDIEPTENTKYFNISNFDKEYYISYEDVFPIDELSEIDKRYQEYIVFNENIITTDITTFYDENDNLIYEFNKSFNLPIIIKEDNKYGVEYNGRLLYVLKDEVVETKYNYNTDKHNSSGVGVLNYHAFYDKNNAEERAGCTTIICHSTEQFKTHLDYFKEHNILTLKMKELEMYIDGKIQLPKSVLITIDDGVKEEHAIEMLTEYQMYGTIFLITSWVSDISNYHITEYIELHSHTHNMHNVGDCPTGQGGGIQCLSEEYIQDDLKKSRDVLNGTTYFCYPFYEYNDYSTKMLKQAGFTMAFIGENWYGDNLVHTGANKFKLNRFVITTYTTLSDFDDYFGQIK